MINNMLASPCKDPLKEDTQTCTQASSELAGESVEGRDRDEPPPDDDSRKNEHRVKYRKLRQKLNSMGFQHDEKCVMPKDSSIPKKQRIMKLALDFEKLVKPQARDYEALEVTCRELWRCLENGSELELQLLGQSRFLPALFDFLAKVPSLHRVEFQQLLRGLETSFRAIYAFASMTPNREYLILTNRLNALVSFTGWLVARQDRKAPTRPQLNILSLSFRLINQLLLHKSKNHDIVTILDTTVELILCSQILKKIRPVLEQFVQEEAVTETELTTEMLKFVLHILRKPVPAYATLIETSKQFTAQTSTDRFCVRLIESLVPFFLTYFCQIHDTQSGPGLQQDLPDSVPSGIQSILTLISKILTCCFEVSFFTVRRALYQLSKQPILTAFLDRLRSSIKYCKREMEEFNSTGPSKQLLNEIIILLGYLSLEEAGMQRRLYESAVLEEAFNLPIQYLMDASLREVYIPSYCCLIHDSKSNLNLFLRDNSPQPLLKALRRQLSARPSLQRKNSTSSLVSVVATGLENSVNYETQRLSLEVRFPPAYWEELCCELEKHV